MRILLASFILAFSSAVAAQSDYPGRPIRLIADPTPGTPEAFASFMPEEMAKWAPVVKQAGVKLD